MLSSLRPNLDINPFRHGYANPAMYTHPAHPNTWHDLSPDNRPPTAGSAVSDPWDHPVDSYNDDFSASSAGTQPSPGFQYRVPAVYDDSHATPADTRPGSSGYPMPPPAHPDQYTRHSSAGPSSASAQPSTSTASPPAAQTQAQDDENAKTYSFVALPGNAVKKRPRRRYDEIERLYHCSWPGCTKSYGTLNHLNAHIVMQRHGGKRSPGEFKELRKQWRKAKKDEAERASMASLSTHSASPAHNHTDDYRPHNPFLHQQYAPRHQQQHQQQQHQQQQHQQQHQQQYQQQSYGSQTPVGVGVPLGGLAGPGVRVGVDDMMARYGSQPHQQGIYDALPPIQQAHARERRSSLYAVPPGMMSAPGSWSEQPQVQHRASYDVRSTQSWDYARPAPHRLSLPLGLGTAPQPQPQPQRYVDLASPSPPAYPPHRASTGTLPPDSTLLTPLPGYSVPQPPAELEYHGEDEREEPREDGVRYWG